MATCGRGPNNVIERKGSVREIYDTKVINRSVNQISADNSRAKGKEHTDILHMKLTIEQHDPH
jgi:hypothetical protein